MFRFRGVYLNKRELMQLTLDLIAVSQVSGEKPERGGPGVSTLELHGC